MKDKINRMVTRNLCNEVNKIKVVLCALWNNENHPDATKIIKKYEKELDEIMRGN